MDIGLNAVAPLALLAMGIGVVWQRGGRRSLGLACLMAIASAVTLVAIHRYANPVGDLEEIARLVGELRSEIAAGELNHDLPER